LIGVGVDIGLRTGTQPETQAVEIVLTPGRAVPACAQTQVHPMHVVLGREYGK
jgi:hypothetical protein